jgi:hypothetical protein
MTPGTLNLINSGPSGGKSTLIGQSIKAHFNGEPFFVRGMDLPVGKVAWIYSDRHMKIQNLTLAGCGLLGHPDLITMNFVEDDQLNLQATPSASNLDESRRIQHLRDIISKRLVGAGVGTIILDLYDEYHTERTNSAKRMAYDGRMNLRWAIQLNVAILGVSYPFKQTRQNAALRIQDRFAGSLKGQASANWKFTLMSAEEVGEPYCLIHTVPGPGEGSPEVYKAVRGTAAEGDPVGLFRPFVEDESQTQETTSREQFWSVLNARLESLEFHTADAVTLAEASGLTPRRETVSRWLKQLVEEGKLESLHRGYWRLHPPDLT